MSSNGQLRQLSFDFPQLRPVNDYLKLQGRFRHLSDETTSKIQDRVNKEYTKLRDKAKPEGTK